MDKATPQASSGLTGSLAMVSSTGTTVEYQVFTIFGRKEQAELDDGQRSGGSVFGGRILYRQYQWAH